MSISYVECLSYGWQIVVGSRIQGEIQISDEWKGKVLAY